MKIIKLSESDLEKIINQILIEQTQNWNPNNLQLGAGGKKNPQQIKLVMDLQKRLIDANYLKLKNNKPTGYFGQLTKKALNMAENKISETNNNNTKNICQRLEPNSDIVDLPQIIEFWKNKFPDTETFGLINRVVNNYASAYRKQGIPHRIACQLSLIQIRPGFKDKNAFVLDSLNKLIYLYDFKGKFIAKSPIISGKNKQSTDPKKAAYALLSWNEQAKKLGFEWVKGKGYVDTTGKNRKYNHELVYSTIEKNKAKFLPKGIYTTAIDLRSDKEYAGGSSNVLSLMDKNKIIAQAIHGYYLEQPREQALQKAKEVLSNPNDKKVSDEFLKLVSNNKINLSQSYGCINVPENFLPYLRKYGVNSYVFNMGENKQNYLVNNTIKYFDKMTNSEYCPSPNSLGAQPITDKNLA